jgi:Ca2+-binding RTX toxin-like protein
VVAFNGNVGQTLPLNVLTVWGGGPMTVGHNITALGNITITVVDRGLPPDPPTGTGPGDDLTVIPGVTVKSTAGDIDLRTGDALYLQATSPATPATSITRSLVSVSATHKVMLEIGYGNNDAGGGYGEIRGQIDTGGSSSNATQVVVNGGAGNDTLYIYLQTALLPKKGVKFDGGCGSNTLFVVGWNTASTILPPPQSEVWCVTDSTAAPDPHGKNAGEILHSKNAATTADVVIDYASLQDLQINGGTGSDFVTFHMAAGTTLMVKVDGGTGKNAFKVMGCSSSPNQILVGNFGPDNTSYADVPYYTYDPKAKNPILTLSYNAKWKTLPQRFQVQNVQTLEVHAGDKGDIVENNTSVPSLLMGGAGNDVLVGGNGADMIFGGPATDTSTPWRQEMFGRGGDDYLFSSEYWYDESKLDPKNPQNAITKLAKTCNNEVLDGGSGGYAGTDVAFSVNDLVLHCQTSVGSGQIMPTLDWLRARFPAYNKASQLLAIDFLMQQVYGFPKGVYSPLFPKCPGPPSP